MLAILLLLVISISPCHASYNMQYGVLDANNRTAQESFCVALYPTLSSYPSDKVFVPLLDLSGKWGACNTGSQLDESVSASINGSIVIIRFEGNCSMIERAQTVQRLGGKGMIMGVVVMAADLQDLCATDNYPAVIPIAFLGSDSIKYLQEWGSSVEVVIISPVSKPSFNYSWIAISAFAMLTVGIGSYWGGLNQHRSITKPMKAQISQETPEVCVSEWSPPVNSEKFTKREFAFLILLRILINLCACCLIAFLIHLAISQTVFVLSSTLAFWSCLNPIFSRIPLGT